VVSGRGTNIFQAMQARAGDRHGRATPTASLMLTDGRQNAGNALAGAQAAKDARADIFYVPAPLTSRRRSSRRRCSCRRR